MSEIKDGAAAFPSVIQYFPDDTNYRDEQGMSLLDYFAAKAMASLIASHNPGYWWMESNYTNLAKYSFRCANAMLRARGQS